ncbi:MAG: hypothetical protein AB8B92_09725, partial [Gammaproteobacteria bacterium]
MLRDYSEKCIAAMKIKRINETQIKTQRVSDMGMSHELYVEGKAGEIDQSIDYPLLKIIADDNDETQYI